MRTRIELENKAMELRKKIWDLEHNCWLPSDKDTKEAEMFKAMYAALMYALGYKAESVYFNCSPYKLA